MKFTYVPKLEVKAAQWNQTNLDEMKELLKDHVDHNEWDGPEVYADFIEDYFLRGLNRSGGGYYMLKFYAGDDMEVDPGQWVVCYDDGEVELMEDEQFRRLYDKKLKDE